MSMNSRMEMIYVDSDGDARKTGIGAMFETQAESWADFRSRRQLEVKGGPFLLDYYNRDGDLADTIELDAKGYTLITGEPVQTEAHYRATDAAYWAEMDARHDH